MKIVNFKNLSDKFNALYKFRNEQINYTFEKINLRKIKYIVKSKKE